MLFLYPFCQQIRRKTVGLTCNHAEIPRNKS
nr:MAG TPA: hypothetical protein [Caudoviricetes sp.]